MCTDVCIDMCTGMCIDMGTGMCTDMCTDMCIDMGTDMCIEMCTDMCIEMCTDMCIDTWRRSIVSSETEACGRSFEDMAGSRSKFSYGLYSHGSFEDMAGSRSKFSYDLYSYSKIWLDHNPNLKHLVAADLAFIVIVPTIIVIPYC